MITRVGVFSNEKTNIYSNNSIAYTGKRSDLTNSILSSSFNRVAKVRKGSKGEYFGTTNDGVNIAIQELSLAKKAKLYIQRVSDGVSQFNAYVIQRVDRKKSIIKNDDDKAVTSIKELSQIQAYLNDLK